MIVVDTNIWSEPLRPQPDARVVKWLEDHEAELAITSITVGELRYGALRLPDGRRKVALLTAIDQLIRDSGQRMLGFGVREAEAYAEIRAQRMLRGLSVGAEDAMIAGICRTADCSLATRNVGDFAETGIRVINPFEPA